MLFYVPAKDGHYVDNGIASWTRLFNLDAPKELICSHEEIWLPSDGNGFINTGRNGIDYLGYCWTSTMGQVGGKNRTGSGVRKAPASEILKNPKRWFYAEFEVFDFGYREMLTMMQVELESNQGYDKLMILNFFIPLGIGDKDKWICSEFSNNHALIGFKYSKATSQSTYQIAVKKIINDTMSPLRTAKRLWQYGVDFYNLDGSLLLAEKKV